MIVITPQLSTLRLHANYICSVAFEVGSLVNTYRMPRGYFSRRIPWTRGVCFLSHAGHGDSILGSDVVKVCWLWSETKSILLLLPLAKPALLDKQYIDCSQTSPWVRPVRRLLVISWWQALSRSMVCCSCMLMHRLRVHKVHVNYDAIIQLHNGPAYDCPETNPA